MLDFDIISSTNDLSTVYLLDQNCFPESFWKFQTWLDFYNHEHVTIVICRRDSDFLGFFVLTMIDDEAELLKIGVHDNFKRQGIGTKILASVIEFSRQKDVKKLFLEVRSDNLAAIKLYNKFSFRLIKTRKDYYTNPPSDALILAWKQE